MFCPPQPIQTPCPCDARWLGLLLLASGMAALAPQVHAEHRYPAQGPVVRGYQGPDYRPLVRVQPAPPVVPHRYLRSYTDPARSSFGNRRPGLATATGTGIRRTAMGTAMDTSPTMPLWSNSTDRPAYCLPVTETFQRLCLGYAAAISPPRASIKSGSACAVHQWQWPRRHRSCRPCHRPDWPQRLQKHFPETPVS